MQLSITPLTLHFSKVTSHSFFFLAPREAFRVNELGTPGKPCAIRNCLIRVLLVVTDDHQFRLLASKCFFVSLFMIRVTCIRNLQCYSWNYFRKACHLVERADVALTELHSLTRPMCQKNEHPSIITSPSPSSLRVWRDNCGATKRRRQNVGHASRARKCKSEWCLSLFFNSFSVCPSTQDPHYQHSLCD